MRAKAEALAVTFLLIAMAIVFVSLHGPLPIPHLARP